MSPYYISGRSSYENGPAPYGCPIRFTAYPPADTYLHNEQHVRADGLVGSLGPGITGGEPTIVLNGGQGNERVIHRTACHTRFAENLRQTSSYVCADEQRWRETL